jgi:CheY-like chemotaxis protein
MSKKILIVDDETEFAEMIQMRLEANGYAVECAADGPSAVQKAAAHPDLILLDVMMPGMDGFEVLRQLRRDNGTRAIPVVMLTAKGEFKTITAAQQAGAQDYLIKPCETQELLKLIRRYIK